MEKLKNVLEYIQKYNQDSGKIKVCGSGHFAIVFDLGDTVFKLTREGEYNQVVNSHTVINYLQVKGVNTPKTYLVEKYKVSNSLELIERLVRLNEKNLMNEILPLVVIDQLNREDKKETLTGVFQEKVDGFAFLNSDMSYTEFQEFILSIPNEHLYKFVMDASTLMQNNIRIDNISKSNFLYNKDKGFYFIDLDSLSEEDNERNSAESPFDCTIQNIICESVNIDRINIFNKDLNLNSFDIYFKFFEVIKNIYLSNLNNEEMKKYAFSYLKWIYYDVGVELIKKCSSLDPSIKQKYSKKIDKILTYIETDQIQEDEKLVHFLPQF